MRIRHAVVLSSYNRPTMVTKAIRSVRFQNRPFQLIVADDDSNADTRAAISLAFGGDTRCEVIYSDRPREGELLDPTIRAVMCINDAVAKISDSVDFVHYLPDDDWYAPGRFAAFERFFDAHPSCDVAYGRMRYVQDGNEVGELYRGTVLEDPACLVDHGQFCHRYHCFARAPKWPVVPGNYAFDAAFFSKLVAGGYAFYPIDEIVNYKRQHAKNLQTTGISNIDDRE